MAYNTSKGKREFGDIEFEDDPQNTQIDFEEGFLALKVSNAQALVISGSAITSSLVFSASQALYAGTFYGNGANITSLPTPAAQGDNSQIQYNNSDVFDGSPNLTFDASNSPNKLAIEGTVSASSDLSASALYIEDSIGGGKVIAPTSDLTLRAEFGNISKNIVVHLNDNNGDAKFKITDNAGNNNASVDSTGAAIFSKITSSSEISASSFYGNASHLKYSVKTVTSNYVVTLDDYTILVDTEDADCTVTVPSASLATSKIYNVKKIHGLNIMTVNSDSGSIDGETEVAITTRNETLKIQCNGSEWYII